jgi:hypothetical protein
MAEADEDYYVPLVDQRVFGAGVKKKKIAFIPAKDTDATTIQTAPVKANIGDRYLSIVLPKDDSSGGSTPTAAAGGTVSTEKLTTCAVCQQPISSSDGNIAVNSHAVNSHAVNSHAVNSHAVNSHETSIAHQVCLEHSHPPSHLDRDNAGLRYLEGYGWDPGSRKGLGARSEGIRIPIKAKAKNDTAGLREIEDEEDIKVKKKSGTRKPDPVVMLDAGKIRKQHKESQKRAEKLQREFYGRDLEAYLGPNG